MKELRELLARGTQGKWHVSRYSVYTNTGEGMIYRVADVNNSADLDLIAAMHNALPELLDAWEMVQAVIDFTDVHRGDVVEVTQDVGYSWCISDLNKILKPYSGRDAHADTRAD